METKKDFEKELGSIVNEAIKKESETKTQEEKRIEEEDNLRFEEIYEWHKNAGYIRRIWKTYGCITYEDFTEEAENKKEGDKWYQRKKGISLFKPGISSGEQGSYAGQGYQQIQIAVEIPEVKEETKKAAIQQAIAAMYLADLLENKIDEKRERARDEMLEKIKTGLQKQENYCLGETIKQELAKYRK